MSGGLSNVFNPILVVVTFLGIFVLLIGVMIAESPTLFIDQPEESYRHVEVPAQFESIDLLYYAETYNNSVPADSILSFELGGWHFEMLGTLKSSDLVQMRRGEQWGFIAWGWHPLKYRDSSGVDVSYFLYDIEPCLKCEMIDFNYHPSKNSSKFYVYDDAMQIVLFFSYDRDTYDNCSDAWDNDALTFLACIEFDQQKTGMNVWSIMAMLLFFKLPNTHLLINMVLGIPLWVGIAVLIAVVIFEVIQSLPFT